MRVTIFHTVRFLLLLVLLSGVTTLHAQYVYTINADSVKITNHCDTAELIIENHTQNVPGFLFNKGRGRTEFRHAVQKLNATTYLIGGDTLFTQGNAWLQGGNVFGTTGVLGTMDSNHLDIYTGNTLRGRWTKTGNLLLGTTVDQGQRLEINGYVSSSGLYNHNTNTRAIDFTRSGPGYSYIQNFLGGQTSRSISFVQIGDLAFLQALTDNGTPWSNFYISNYPVGPVSILTGGPVTNAVFTPAGNTIIGNTTDNGLARLQVTGKGYFSDTLKLPNIIGRIADTVSLKPAVVDGGGNVYKANSWPLPEANNGLSYSGSVVQLGGNLTRNTIINQNDDSLILVTGNTISFVQKDNGNQPTILPGNTQFGQVPLVKRSKRNGFILEENALASTAAVTGSGNNFLYSRQVTNETFPAGVTSAAFGSTNSFFSELIQGNPTGTVLNWHIAGPSSLRGRPWNSWITVVNQGNSFYGANPFPFVHHSLPLYISPAKNAYYSFYGNAISAGASFAVDADNIPLYLVNLPVASFDTNSNKPLVYNPSTGTVQYSYWPSGGASAFSGVIDSSLLIRGMLTAREVRLMPSAWADYVFDKTYRLPSLYEIESYIKQNNHLPGIPSAAEVKQHGIDMGENQAALLKKIEELTLYIIEQEKNAQKQRKEIDGLKEQNKRLDSLEQQIIEMKKNIGK